uniref:3CxxC-type domain-containing protein n=2 Tax=Arion vulgaris TaxID=1028688 RepID=A0A0B7AX68_9EUPU
MPEDTDVVADNVVAEDVVAEDVVAGDVVADKTKQKRRRRRGRKGKKELNNENVLKQENIKENVSTGVNGTGVNGTGNGPLNKKDKEVQPKRQKKSRRGADRYFGRFCCKVCRRSWDSAFVFTRTGTKKVLYKQRCMKCDSQDAWVNPHKLELLLCSICRSRVCECLCEDCGQLKHVRYLDSDNKKDKKVDNSFDYCDCDKRNKSRIGATIRPDKHHMSKLCQKCLQGRPCVGAGWEGEDASEANEP